MKGLSPPFALALSPGLGLGAVRKASEEGPERTCPPLPLSHIRTPPLPVLHALTVLLESELLAGESRISVL
jgi:hypothetical protein